jgi:hypothetical protein
MRNYCFLVFVFCAFWGYLVVAADVLELANRATVEGKILYPAESTRKSWQIQMTEGIVVELPNKTTVVRQVTQPLALEQYYAKVPFLPESADTHLKLAEVCMTQGLVDLGNLHYQRVLDFDSENIAARQALYHRKIDSEWLSRDELMLRQGYVKNSRGVWMTRQRLLIDEGKVQLGQEDRNSIPTVQNPNVSPINQNRVTDFDARRGSRD